MSNLDDIFDLPGGGQQTEQPEKKQRKKVEMSDEKKQAMLERLRIGREKRAENLKAKKEPKEPKEPKEIKSKEEVIKTNEDERLSFIKMMAGKSKPIEKVERPKKKVYKEESSDSIVEKPKEETKTDNKAKTITATPMPTPAPIAVIKQPVIIRTFKKPIWA